MVNDSLQDFTQQVNDNGDQASAEEPRLAVIDIGSNSIRLVVAETSRDGACRILDEERESTRLAHSLAHTGRLSDASIEATMSCLRRFKKIATGLKATHLRTIATCAVREAANGEQFRRQVRDDLGMKIEIVSAQVEAQLAFKSIQNAFDVSDKNVAIADLGGGSTEVILASAGHVEEIYAMPLGAVRLTESADVTDKICGEPYDRMVGMVDLVLKRTIGRPPFVPQCLFGCGGTFTNLGSMLIAERGQAGTPLWGYQVSRAELRHLLDRLRKMSLKRRRTVPGLNADRADVIVAGLVVIDRLMRRLKVNVLRIHDRGVRDGLLLTMIDGLRTSNGDNDDRGDAVQRFAVSCGVDLAHARHVAILAASLFDQLVEPCQLKRRDKRILEAAAMLQDVGYLINYDQHHKHSYHLILNSQLPGFRRHELEMIANVARYHRGAKPKRKHANLRQLSDLDQHRVGQLAAILRLAGGLDRDHSQRIESVCVRHGDGQTELEVVAHADPEVDLWAARSRAKLFEKTFNTKVSIRPRSTVPEAAVSG